MPLQVNFTQAAVVTTTQSNASIRLHHGTQSVDNLIEFGIDAEQAMICGGAGGEFWATIKPEDAETFAYVAPGDGRSAIVSLDLPYVILKNCLEDPKS